jgi:hypothetical protein
MPKYRVLVEGKNFVLEVDGKRRRYGFYQTVFVESADPRQAELDAVAVVRGSEELSKLVCNRSDDPPRLHLEKIEEIGKEKNLPTQTSGRILYPEKSWWQFWR